MPVSVLLSYPVLRMFSSIRFLISILGSSALLLCSVANAQNANAEFNGIYPVAPTGLDQLPLEDGPWTFRTGEAMNIQVDLVTRLTSPMAMTFLPDGSILVITRPGKIFKVANGKAREVMGGPEAVSFGESGGIGTVHGYMDIALHPDFDDNGYVYLLYHRPDAERPTGIVALGRGRWTGDSLTDFTMLYDSKILNGGGNILFGNDGKLYLTTPDSAGMVDEALDAQNLASPGGKLLRLNDDGTVPADNPFVNTPGALPEIWSYGHRYSLGLAVHPGSGELWESEHGPNGGDEINIIRPGADYGWPAVSFGRTYNGPWQAEVPTHDGYEMPVVYWMPSVAVAGMTFYTGDALSKWKGDLFVGGLREGEVNGTGHLERILFNDEMQELRRESLLTTLHKRIRDVVQGPDDYLYLVLEERDGGILRIRPAE